MQPKSRSLMGHLGRTLIVMIAFALALALALIVLMLLGSWSMGDELRDGYQPDGDMAYLVDALSMLFGGASFLLVLPPTLTILPALIAVIIAEVVQIRSALYYIVAGGASVAVLPVLASSPDTAFNSHYLAIFATAGFSGGLLYWLMAGRNA